MARKRQQDSDDTKPLSPLMRIIVKVITVYAVVSAVITGFFMLLFFKFVVGFGLLQSVAAIGALFAVIAICAKYLPDEDPSIFDLFD